jgi:hypothetical protein
MNELRVLAGAVAGMGIVATLPFTGKGSVLGPTTLCGSLSGFGTAVLTLGAGAAGACLCADIEETKAMMQRTHAKIAAAAGMHVRAVDSKFYRSSPEI